jgi:hypothetical protein
LQRFPSEKKSGKYLAGKKKVSTFATANEKQTPLTVRQAVLSEAK